MSKIAYVKQLGSLVVHVSIADGEWLGAALHEVTICGQKIKYGHWTEAPRPTETGMESDLRRCKKCDHKRVEGVPAFDYEEELAALEAALDRADEECAPEPPDPDWTNPALRDNSLNH